MWVPRTKLGLMVKNEELTSMIEVIHSGLPVKEFEIVDKLIPNLEEDIINVGRVQRVTDSGRRMRFRVVTAVGNQDGFIGIGHAKGKEAGPTIRKAIARAKMNIRNVKRGCGSWQCGCGNPHTVPFKIRGISGSVKVDLLPAPRGVGLVGGEIAKKVLKLAGIKDAWVHTSGHTRTSLNFAYAVYDALVNTNYVKLKQSDIDNLKIVSDVTKIPVEDGQE
ncbi:MAG: 30S ribosomal protein S5 [Candidatus Altiarchaeota archaeon]